MLSANTTLQALYTFPQSIGIAGGRPSSYYFVGSQVDNLFCFDPHHVRPAIPLCLPSRSAEREPGVPIRQTTPERGSASPIGHSRSPTSPASSRTGSTTISHHSLTSPTPLSMQLSSSSSSSGGAHARWQNLGRNWSWLRLILMWMTFRPDYYPLVLTMIGMTYPCGNPEIKVA